MHCYSQLVFDYFHNESTLLNLIIVAYLVAAANNLIITDLIETNENKMCDYFLHHRLTAVDSIKLFYFIYCVFISVRRHSISMCKSDTDRTTCLIVSCGKRTIVTLKYHSNRSKFSLSDDSIARPMQSNHMANGREPSLAEVRRIFGQRVLIIIRKKHFLPANHRGTMR